jgi:hypothetical protein
MAGVKITDLGTLTTAVDADLLYIVDVSDTSQSPQGTSKQIELGSIVSSGTWTPTFSTFVSAIIDATLYVATYQRIGNVVTCSISLSIDVDFSSDNTGSVQFTLPFATTTGGACGSLSSSNITKQFNGAVRGASTTQGRIVMQSEDTSLVTSAASCHAIFQYEIN